MAGQFDKYRSDGDTLDDEFFNRRFKDVDLRITDLEGKIGQFDTAVDALIARGLEQLNTQLQASIAAMQGEIDAVEETIASAEQTISALEEAVQEIISGGTLPASAISVAAIPGVDGDTVQEVLAEQQTEIATLRDQVNGIGDNHAVADYTEAATLTGLDKSDVIHVADNGAGKWIRYQVMSAGDGTWAGVTKVVLGTQDQQPATHSHAIADVTGLQTALNAKANASDVTTSLAGKQAAAANLTSWAAITPATKADVTATNLKWLGASFTVSTAAPSGGTDGDFWFERQA